MNTLKKLICFITVLILAFSFTACGNETKPAVDFPFAELNEIYDSDDTAKGDRFDENNNGRKYIVNSATVKSVSFKSTTEYDVFCYVKSGDRTFNFRLFVDTSLGDVTREYLNSLEKGDVISFEGSFLSQTSRAHLSIFNNIKFLNTES